MTDKELNETLNQKFPKIYWQVKEFKPYWDIEEPLYEIRGMVKISGIECWRVMEIEPKFLNDDFINYIANRTAYQISRGLIE